MLQPKQSLGQNWLRDPNTIRKIAGALEAAPGDAAVEIGPGTGALTGVLLERHPRMVALEVDERAVDVLQSEYPSLDVRHQDVLEVDWRALSRELGGPLHVIGNLPYYITSPILFSLVDARDAVAEVVVMMQLEVAERIVAGPRTKAYGILSVVFQRYCDADLLFRVSRNVFFPKPDVTSAVVRLTFRPDAPPPSPGEDLFRSVVRGAFGQRRKTLRNSLRSAFPELDELPEEWTKRRAEELTPDEFARLSRYLAGVLPG
jgi:16S rRNA (adenine1518-N6/adenine1519-N6)-dimethyltransferase